MRLLNCSLQEVAINERVPIAKSRDIAPSNTLRSHFFCQPRKTNALSKRRSLCVPLAIVYIFQATGSISIPHQTVFPLSWIRRLLQLSWYCTIGPGRKDGHNTTATPTLLFVHRLHRSFRQRLSKPGSHSWLIHIKN